MKTATEAYRFRLAHWSSLFVAALSLLWAVDSVGAPMTFNTALPVAEGEFVFREQVVLDQSGDDPSGADRDRMAWSAVSVLGYGVNSDLSLFTAVPYVDKRLELIDSGSRRARSARGLGDISVFARYTAFKNNFRGGSFRVAPFAGVEAPTGADDESDSFGRLPASVQPGSGSWDPFAGVVATYQVLDFQIDAQASYRANTEANGFEFGDVARVDASLQYRLWPRVLGAGVPGFLYGVLETNLIHQGKNQSAGSDDPNSGGLSLYVLPGVQYVTRRWIVEGGVQLPVFQDLNGTALEKEYVVRAGFRLNF
tara:strand:- start:1444 stop:2373 length:930 start_codon:yes stop_codon:yes gene_type:complete